MLESDGLTVGSVALSVNRVINDNTTSLVSDLAQTDLVTSGNGSIVAQSTTGNIMLSDGGDSNNQSIHAGGTGNVLVQTLSTTGADINVNANANVISGNGNISLLGGNNVYMGAGSATAQVNTGSGTIDVVAGSGNMVMSSGSLLNSTSGDIRVMASSGITVGNIVGSTNVSLIATAGSIVDADAAGASNVNVKANGLRLFAGTGVGQSTSALETNVSVLSAQAGSGGIYLLQSVDVIVGGVLASVNRVAANASTNTASSSDLSQFDLVTRGGSNGNIVLQSLTGSIILNDGGVVNNQAINADGSGQVLVQSLASTGADININANVLSGSGNISILGGHNVNVAAGSATATVQTGAGTVDVEAANGSVTMTAGSLLQSTSGAIRVLASTDITVGEVYTSTSAANVALTATTGNILNGNGAALNVKANALRLNAGNGAGQSGNSLYTQVNTLSAQAGSGGIYLLNNQAITVGDVAVTVSQVMGNAGTTAVTDAKQSDLVTAANGSIVLQTSAGGITLNDGTPATNLNQAISAGGSGNVLVQTLASSSADINICAPAMV